MYNIHTHDDYLTSEMDFRLQLYYYYLGLLHLSNVSLK